MKKALVLASTTAIVVTSSFAAYAGTADGQGAQKRSLDAVSTDAQDQCEASGSTDASTGPSSGFVILNAPGKVGAVTKIVGEVALKKAEPNKHFLVFLAQDGKCTATGTLTTNGQGNGNSHIDAPGMGGTYYVVLQDIDTTERYASSEVALK